MAQLYGLVRADGNERICDRLLIDPSWWA